LNFAGRHFNTSSTPWSLKSAGYRSKGRILPLSRTLKAKLNPGPAVAGENKGRYASLPHEQTDGAADILD
jgi:hypothetical protein